MSTTPFQLPPHHSPPQHSPVTDTILQARTAPLLDVKTDLQNVHRPHLLPAAQEEPMLLHISSCSNPVLTKLPISPLGSSSTVSAEAKPALLGFILLRNSFLMGH